MSAAWYFRCKLLWRNDECIFLPCFNAQPDSFAVMSYCVVALSLFSSDIATWSADSYIQCNYTLNKGSVRRRICILCSHTSPKRWFGNMNMTSNCDVTNSTHQIQMTTICHWMSPPPMKIFCVRQWFKYIGHRRPTSRMISRCHQPYINLPYCSAESAWTSVS